jgi:hypothetical protein
VGARIADPNTVQGPSTLIAFTAPWALPGGRSPACPCARGRLPIPREDVVSHSANTHLIPANAQVRSELARLRGGEVVHLSGPRVDGKRDDGPWIKTSLTRQDSGPGACEVLLVERVEVR